MKGNRKISISKVEVKEDSTRNRKASDRVDKRTTLMIRNIPNK